MASVKSWLPAFFKSHRARFNPHDWPEDPAELKPFTGMFLAAFAAREVTADEAEAASVALGPNPPEWRKEHLPKILAAVEADRRSRGALGSKDEAAAHSTGCARCGGSGMVPVFVPEARGLGRVRGASAAAHCVCPLGRFMRGRVAPDTLAAIPDLADVLAGRSRWGLAPSVPPPTGDAPADPLALLKGLVRAHSAVRPPPPRSAPEPWTRPRPSPEAVAADPILRSEPGAIGVAPADPPP